MSRLDPISGRRPARAAMLVSLVSLVLVQCDRKSGEPSVAGSTDAPDPAEIIDVPRAPRSLASLTRGELVSAAGRAASAYAQGATPQKVDPLVGRSFAVRIPFGCNGPSAPAEGGAGDGLARWSWAPDRQTIQISLTPGDWTASTLIVPPRPGVDRPVWEAVEGFWIPRPWLAAEACPTVRAEPPQTVQTAISPQTVGIAAVFDVGGSRIGRRDGKAYVFTVRPQDDQPLAAPIDGYRLVLEGRVVGFPEGRALRCRATSPDQRPTCVAAVQLDKVAFEDASGSTLGEWRGS